MKPKQYIYTLVGWASLQLIILLVTMITWNLVMPSLGVNKINFWQVILLYALFNFFKFNWVKSFNDNNLNSKIEK